MKNKKLKIAVLATLLSLVFVFATLTVYAYFSTRVYVYTENENGGVNKEVFHAGMQLQLLFGELNSSLNANGAVTLPIPNYSVTKVGDTNYLVYNDKTAGVKFDPNAQWGTAANPYVISETRHLQNLSALQSVGYFDLMYLNSNFDSLGDYRKTANIPYFLICTPDGKPVTVGGVNESGATADTIEIKPIGSAEHPFVGVIGGAFVEGTTTVGGKTSSVSAIHNVKVQTTTNQTDVGLFGYIGFLGEEPKDVVTNPTFAGAVSSVQDLLLSDVQIIVDEPNIVEIISDLFIKEWEDYFGEGKYHRYTYTNKTETNLPQETHHIGIFAGHVSYATIDKINVYYSEENVKAIDLKGVDASDNYYTASGILGMFYNMNCKVFNSYKEETNGTDITYVINGNCMIQIGTGTSSDEVEQVIGGSGSGTGGGIYSGNGRGYVTAAEIFTRFNNVDVQNPNQELLWQYKTSNDGAWSEPSILILATRDDKGKITSATFVDGTQATVTIDTDVDENITVYTVSDGNGNSWTNFFVREVFFTTDGTSEIKYTTPAGSNVYACEMLGNKYNGQPLWKYSAGGKGIWHYGIRVNENVTVENGVTSDSSYVLEDSTVAFFDGNKIYTTADGTENGEIKEFWYSFFVTKTVTTKTKDKDGKVSETKEYSHFMYDFSTDPVNTWNVTLFEHKPLTLIEAYGENQKTHNSELLCVQWQMPTAQGEVASGLYYFYDGVFTFGLSSPNDTVRDTWRNDAASKLYLGPDTPDGWTVDEDRGDRALIALLKPITNNKDLNDAIVSGKQFYISAQPVAGEAYFMSLNTLNDSKDFVVGNEKYESKDTPGQIPNTKVSLENNLASTLAQNYKNGLFTKIPTVPITGATQEVKMSVSLTDLENPDFWGNYTILNIGRTSESLTLASLKQEYNIVPTNVTENGQTKYYYYRNDTGAYVGTASGTNSIDSDNAGKIPNYVEYDEYIYYTVDYVIPDDGYTFGSISGTRYEDIRIYTFTFWYQPPDKAAPVPLGYTTVKVDAYTQNTGQNPSYVSYMPDFHYGMVYFGQEEPSNDTNQTDPSFFYRQTRFDGNNHTLQENGDGLLATITPVTQTTTGSGWNPQTTTTYAPNNNGDYVFNLSYPDEGIDATNIPMVNITANRFHGDRYDKNNKTSTNDTAIADQAIVSEGFVSKEVANTWVEYYYYDVTTKNYYYYDNGWKNNGTVEPERTTVNENGETVKQGLVGANAVLMNRYPAYTFASNNAESPSYLQFLHQFADWNYWFGYHGDTYSLWAGTEAQYEELDLRKGSTTVSFKNTGNNWNPYYTDYKFEQVFQWLTEGVLVFESGKDYCYIQFTYDRQNLDIWYQGQENALVNGGDYLGNGGELVGYREPTKSDHSLTQYVGYNYNSSTETLEYTLSATKTENTRLYVYVIEGILDTTAGVNTFIPEDVREENSNTHALDASQYVLWPQKTLTQTGYNTNTGYDFAKKTVSALTSVDSGDVHARLTSSEDPVYSALPLYGPNNTGLNWGNSEGYILGSSGTYGLNQKFQMADQGFFGKLHIDENGYVSSVTGGKSNMMIVPVGSNNVESPIPKGCVAFSVNAQSTQTIRIIVSVPTSEYYLRENEALDPMDLLNDYYVGVWKIPSITPGSEVTFKKSEAIEKFELPRSYSFSFDDDPSKVEKNGEKHYINVIYDADGDGTYDVEYDENGNIIVEQSPEYYRTYLNGDTFLVAYEFTIQGAGTGGTYIIGTAHGADGVTGGKDIPMEIVHFSVSGTASAGRDGVQGNQLGAIDFVYDNTQGAIVTIDTRAKDGQTTLPNADGNENYQNYYSSQTLLYTDLEQKDSQTYLNLNQVELYIRRWLDSTRTDTSTTYQSKISYYIGSDAATSQAGLIKFKKYLDNGDVHDPLTAEPGVSGS